MPGTPCHGEGVATVDQRITEMMPRAAGSDPERAFALVTRISDPVTRGRELSTLLAGFAGRQSFERSAELYASAPWPADDPQRVVAALAIASARAAQDRAGAIRFIQADSNLSEPAKAEILARLQ